MTQQIERAAAKAKATLTRRLNPKRESTMKDNGSVETWLPLPVSPWNETHEVSSLGRVRRSKPGRMNRARAGLLLSARPHAASLRVRLGSKAFNIGSLVAQAFIGPRADGHRLIYLDGDGRNVAASNLRYVSADTLSHDACFFCANQPPVPAAVLGYAAGLLDGEGNICISRKLNRARSKGLHVYRVSVVNTDIRVLQWLVERFGGKVHVNRKASQPDARTYNRTLYAWRLNCAQGASFLEHVYPYLVIKQEQAELIFELQRRLNRYASDWKPLTQEDVDYREALAERLRSLTLAGGQRPRSR